MKKIILLRFTFSCITSTLVLTSHAQIVKNEILLGGAFGHGSSNYTNGAMSNFSNLNPRLGYAITNNSVLSLRLGFNYGKNESSDGNMINKNTNFSTGLSWQRFFPIKNKVGWFTDLSAAFNAGSSRQKYIPTSGTTESTSKGYSAALNPGVYFMPSESLLLSANVGGLSYGHSKYKTSGQPTDESSNFNINLLNYFGFGIDFIINKRKR